MASWAPAGPRPRLARSTPHIRARLTARWTTAAAANGSSTSGKYLDCGGPYGWAAG